MDAQTIQLGLWALLGQKSRVVMPNFTPRGWFECDMWSCNLNDYGIEHEIKLSLADFRNDAKKHTRKFEGYKKPEELEPVDGQRVRELAHYSLRFKHERLAAGDPEGPSRFYYVAPCGLLAVDAVPVWAGLMEFDPAAPVYRSIRRVKEAPRLHRTKVDREVKIQAWRACYHRFWRAKERSLLKKLQISEESEA